MSTGALVYDYDGGHCPRNATSQACTTLPTAIATVTSTPTAAITKAKTVTIAVGTSLGVVAIIISCVTAFLLYTRRQLRTKSTTTTTNNNNNNGAVMGTPTSAAFLYNPAAYPSPAPRVVSSYQASSDYRISTASPRDGTHPHLPEV